MRHVGYGIGLNNSNGWIGHNGGVPGYQSLTIYLPSERATIVALINTNVSPPKRTHTAGEPPGTSHHEDHHSEARVRALVA